MLTRAKKMKSMWERKWSSVPEENEKRQPWLWPRDTSKYLLGNLTRNEYGPKFMFIGASRWFHRHNCIDRGCYFSRFITSFSKNNNSTVYCWEMKFSRRPWFSAGQRSLVLQGAERCDLCLDSPGPQTVATFEREDADSTERASLPSLAHLCLLHLWSYTEEITNIHGHCEIFLASQLVLFTVPVKTPHSQSPSPSKVHIAGNSLEDKSSQDSFILCVNKTSFLLFSV